MAGKIRTVLEKIIEKKAQGNPTLIATTKTKLILKGINPDKFDYSTPDDPEILRKVETLARQLGIAI